MRVPLSWLQEYVDITLPPEELAERLTLAGLEVTRIEKIGDWWDPEKIRVGEILRVERHPNADRLVLATVDYGADEPLTVVTGAPNLFPYVDVERPGLKVAFALAGAYLIDPYDPERKRKKLKPTKIRGIRSEGMVCSERELGLSDEHEGILLLPEDAPVGTPLVDYLGDVVIEFDITPNMARCLSMTGVAREVHAVTQAPLHIEMPTMRDEGEPPAEALVDVVIEDPDLCHRYAATVIRDIHIAPAPFWMQYRLNLAGMRPISNVVDITNYVMLEWGQPLHAFDYDKLVERAGGKKPTIIVRRARPGERIVTLDGVERELDPDMLLIADEKGPIAIAGVMGGLETEVTENTRNILLESANFDYINNRRTAQKLKLPSEASRRFSRGIPEEMVPVAAKRASELMRVLAGGTIAKGMVDNYPVKQERIEITITPREIERQLGVAIPVDEIVDILRRLDFQVTPPDTPHPDAPIRLVAPWHRLDVRIPADVVEEVARIWGYDRIPETLMSDVLPPQRRNWELEARERVRDILVAAGLQDIIPYSLTNLENCAKLRPEGPPPNPEDYIRLANPLTVERSVMRRTVLVSLLETLAFNQRYTDRQALFEIGRVYLPKPGEPRPEEPYRIGIALMGPRDPESVWAQDREPMDYYDLKGVVEVLLDRMHLEGVTFHPLTDHPTFGPRAAALMLDGERIGVLGEVHPLVREAFDLPRVPVCLAELEMAPFVQAYQQPVQLTPISTFPPVKEDLAFVVDEDVPAEEVARAIRDAGGYLVVHVALFDVYRGPNIPAGKKSLAFRVTYQAPDRTLKDKDVERIRRRIVKELAKRLNAQLRT
ncbi:MAG: phenylalanine--tRNA ligase subunit beta [Chloroflexi bacterium]|nr:phenylalanine--tRNA ligase subunit beta [Chloroflexota bacterium]